MYVRTDKKKTLQSIVLQHFRCNRCVMRVYRTCVRDYVFGCVNVLHIYVYIFVQYMWSKKSANTSEWTYMHMHVWVHFVNNIRMFINTFLYIHVCNRCGCCCCFCSFFFSSLCAMYKVSSSIRTCTHTHTYTFTSFLMNRINKQVVEWKTLHTSYFMYMHEEKYK